MTGVSSVGTRVAFRVLRSVFLRPDGERLERLGTDYGGWYVPLERLGPRSVVYSVGVGEDISFDVELIRRTGCNVHAFDPTSRAREYVRAYRDLDERFRFHEYGLWNTDTVVRFYAPKDPAHVSHSIKNVQKTDAYFEAPVKRLSSLMRALSHESVDLLKMDVEGAEHEIVRDMLVSGIRPTVLLVELDHPSPFRTVATVALLHLHGYRLVRLDNRNATLIGKNAAASAGARRACRKA